MPPIILKAVVEYVTVFAVALMVPPPHAVVPLKFKLYAVLSCPLLKVAVPAIMSELPNVTVLGVPVLVMVKLFKTGRPCRHY